MFVQTGDNVGIGGFIITGTGPKSVLLRAIGPSLIGTVPNALNDTVLELHGPPGFTTIVNDNWRDTQETEIEATGIPPTNNLESAILVSLTPGNYTGIVRGNGTDTGVALVEVYDLDTAAASRLANISTRAFIQTGDDIVIAGFILGNGLGADNLVVRGIGPSLSGLGVPTVLANPTLELRDNNGALVRANNDWQEDPVQAALITAAGLAPSDEFESAIAVTLPPGPYTALLAGALGGFGNGLVEVYDLGDGTPLPTPTPGLPTPTPTPPPPGTPTPTPIAEPCPENFDNSSSLPPGWVATNEQGPWPLWAISTTSSDTQPNNAFVNDAAVTSDKRLDSRSYTIFSEAAQISFRNNYDFEFSDGTYWDGGVLEVSINGGPFVDVTDASVGGVFVSGGYNGTIDHTADNPIRAKPAWGSTSGGYINSVINLGAALQGQSIVLRFRMGTDRVIGAPGWHIDTLVITGGSCL